MTEINSIDSDVLRVWEEFSYYPYIIRAAREAYC